MLWFAYPQQGNSLDLDEDIVELRAFCFDSGQLKCSYSCMCLLKIE